MSYQKQNFTKGQTLKADHMNHIEEGIKANADAVEANANAILANEAAIKLVASGTEKKELDITFKFGSISSAGINNDATNEIISEAFNLGGNDFVDVKLVDDRFFKFAVYACNMSTGEIKMYVHSGFLSHGTIRCSDVGYNYVVRVACIDGTTNNLTVANAKKAFSVTCGNHGNKIDYESLSAFCKGENITYPCDEPFFKNEISTSEGYKANEHNVVTKPIYIGDHNSGLTISLTGTTYKIAIYAINSSGALSMPYSGWITTPYTFTATDKSLGYIVRVARNDTAQLTMADVEAISKAVSFRYLLVNEVVEDDEIKYGYERQYDDITHTMAWERKEISNGQITASNTSLLAKLPNCVCVEVKKNYPQGQFKIFKHNGSSYTELTSGYSNYSYRFMGDYTSTYYVQAINQDGSSIDVNYGPQAVKIYVYTDVGVALRKFNDQLYGKKIAVIGDSIVQGRFCKNGTTVNMAMAKPWSHHIAEACNVEPANFGIGGQIVHNFDWRSLYLHCEDVKGYDVVFVCCGTNDYGNNISESNFRSAFTYALSKLKSNNTKVVVCTPVYRTNRTAANTVGLTLVNYVDIEKGIAESSAVDVIDLYTLTHINAFTSTLTDGLHPNEAGQKIIADIVLEAYQ